MLDIVRDFVFVLDFNEQIMDAALLWQNRELAATSLLCCVKYMMMMMMAGCGDEV